MKYDTACYRWGVYDAPVLSVNEDMSKTVIYRAERGWFWQLWIDARLVIFGWAETHEKAQLNARMA